MPSTKKRPPKVKVSAKRAREIEFAATLLGKYRNSRNSSAAFAARKKHEIALENRPR